MKNTCNAQHFRKKVHLHLTSWKRGFEDVWWGETLKLFRLCRKGVRWKTNEVTWPAGNTEMFSLYIV